MYMEMINTDIVVKKSFRAAPRVNANTEVKVAIYGDMGKAEIDESLQHWPEIPSINTTKRIEELVNSDSVDIVMHIGDISYAVGYSFQWDSFFDQIESIATRVPYMAAIGNHERDFNNSKSFYDGSDSGGECGIPFESRFRMPIPAKDQFWYSINYGSVHFLFMSTEHDFTNGSIQYKYIEEDLKKVDRSITPWVVFAGHRSMYVSSYSTGRAGDEAVSQLLRDTVEHLLHQYKVDLAVWGHTHIFERSCPVYQQQCQPSNNHGQDPNRFFVAPQGTIHTVCGMAGMGLSHNLKVPPPAWSIKRDDQEYGYCRFHVYNSTALHFQFLENTAGILREDFWILK